MSRTILVAHPGADLYGSDLQMLETVSGLVEAGWRVLVVVPREGPLVNKLQDQGARVILRPFPVLRRAQASVTGVAQLAWQASSFVVSASRFIKRTSVDAVLVNTVTLPWWILAGRLAGTPTLCHVHEAETQAGAVVRFGLAAPLAAASRIVVNSQVVLDTTSRSAPGIRTRARLVYNGVPGPSEDPVLPHPHGGPYRLVVVTRLSPGKDPGTAIRALALLRDRGMDVTLDVGGTAFTGYEWFAQELQSLAHRLGVASSVTWHGYVSPVWDLLRTADAVIAPSLREGFGNFVVEAQLAARPVVATAMEGHLETVADEETGLLFPPGDAAALATAIQRLIHEPGLSSRLARDGRLAALRRFTPQRYRQDLVGIVEEAVASS